MSKMGWLKTIKTLIWWRILDKDEFHKSLDLTLEPVGKHIVYHRRQLAHTLSITDNIWSIRFTSSVHFDKSELTLEYMFNVYIKNRIL